MGTNSTFSLFFLDCNTGIRLVGSTQYSTIDNRGWSC